MRKKENNIYVEPKSYFPPSARRVALEYDRDHNTGFEEKLTPEMLLRLLDWLAEKGINETEAWEALDYMMYGNK